MADLAQTLAVRTTLSHERADVLARCWRLLAAERHWSNRTHRVGVRHGRCAPDASAPRAGAGPYWIED